MARSSSSSGEVTNWALAALPAGECQRLLRGLELVHLKLQEVLHEAGGPIPHFYFPCGGLVSLLSLVESGKAVEVGVVGKEGVVGLPLFLGGHSALYQAIVQSPGPALRMPADRFRTEIRRNKALAAVLLRYLDAFLIQLSQSAVCNCMHPVHKRCCRWLLMAQDRIGSDQLPFTQKFLALMLTVRLASVSEVAGKLQRAGLIRYSRGDLTILDRPGLEGESCPCYRIIKDRFDRLQA